jgi:hypothetical protein
LSTKSAVSFYQVAAATPPAAGTEFALRAPGQGLWRVISVAFLFTTSAAVANRRVALVADDQTDIWFAAESTVDVAAGAAVRFGAYPGASASGLTAVLVNIPLPDGGLVLQPGHRLRSLTTLLDVGDTYTQIRAQVQEYPQGPDFEWLPSVDTQLAAME